MPCYLLFFCENSDAIVEASSVLNLLFLFGYEVIFHALEKLSTNFFNVRRSPFEEWIMHLNVNLLVLIVINLA